MSVVVIDYGSGNLRSAAKAIEREVSDKSLSLTVQVSANPDDVRKASHVILPGVGAFADCRAGLLALDGMADALHETVLVNAKPFLGVCVGMQLMGTLGLEHGKHEGLGWLNGTVRALEPRDENLKIPHIGWNELYLKNVHHPVLNGLNNRPHVYFVHSYYFDCDSSVDVLATVNYGGYIPAVIGRDNMIGTQFHPEKSQEVGLKLISNFLRWKP